MTRDDHMKWCKERALDILESGDIPGAYASMASDLGNHPETAGHDGIQLGMILMMGGHLKTHAEMEKFIKDFN
jgi:hypothetical protein